MSPPDIEFLCALVRVRSGLVLRGERNFFIETRLAPLARRERMGSVAELVDQVLEQPSGPLANAVIEAMTVQDTAFFRDRTAFQALADAVLPDLAARRPGGLRIWSAGCSQGQEAYSVAMLVAEATYPRPPVEILGADISTMALEKARSGIYTHFEVQRGLPIRRLLRHFEDTDDTWRIRDSLRAMVRWMRLNLVDKFTVEDGYDLILCRHVVSDFAPDARAAVLERLQSALRPGGRLMLGPAEAPPAGFTAVTGAPGVFRRSAEADADAVEAA